MRSSVKDSRNNKVSHMLSYKQKPHKKTIDYHEVWSMFSYRCWVQACWRWGQLMLGLLEIGLACVTTKQYKRNVARPCQMSISWSTGLTVNVVTFQWLENTRKLHIWSKITKSLCYLMSASDKRETIHTTLVFITIHIIFSWTI